jgi:hypothetical protein
MTSATVTSAGASALDSMDASTGTLASPPVRMSMSGNRPQPQSAMGSTTRRRIPSW